MVSRKICTAIRHVAFEDLGSFEPALIEAGYDVRYIDVGLDDLDAIVPTASDLLVVLGGPIGVNEQDRYPFLKAELRLITARLQAGRPTMGIYLGAQLMASALGAKVYPCVEKEIGFARLSLTPEGRDSCVSAFEYCPVLHWHGDTFDLPAGAVRLASTKVCLNQAFALSREIIRFQFHPEAGARGFERWLVGHTVEMPRRRVFIHSFCARNAIASRLALDGSFGDLPALTPKLFGGFRVDRIGLDAGAAIGTIFSQSERTALRQYGRDVGIGAVHPAFAVELRADRAPDVGGRSLRHRF